jgi:hypothetical protein
VRSFQGFNGTSVDRHWVVGAGTWTVSNGAATPGAPASAYLAYTEFNMSSVDWVVDADIEFLGPGNADLGVGVAGIGTRGTLTCCGTRVRESVIGLGGGAYKAFYDARTTGALDDSCGGFCAYMPAIELPDPAAGTVLRNRIELNGTVAVCEGFDVDHDPLHSATTPAVYVQDGIGRVQAVVVYQLGP